MSVLSPPTSTLTSNSSSSSSITPTPTPTWFISSSTTSKAQTTTASPLARGPAPHPYHRHQRSSASTFSPLGAITTTNSPTSLAEDSPQSHSNSPNSSRSMLRVNTDTTSTSRARSNSAQPTSSTQAYFALSPNAYAPGHGSGGQGPYALSNGSRDQGLDSRRRQGGGGSGMRGDSITSPTLANGYHHQMSKSLSYAPTSPSTLSLSTTSATEETSTGLNSKTSFGYSQTTLRPVSPNNLAGRGERGNHNNNLSQESSSTTIRLIQRALENSNDHGETLDLSRHKLDKIGDDEVEMFRRGVGKGRKGVWRLALSYNALKDGSISLSFSQLDRLRYLNLKGNKFTKFPTALSQLCALEILDLSKNAITSFPDQPGRLIHLKVLSLSHNAIYTLPTYLTEFASLKVFKVDGNPIEWPPNEVLGPLIDSEISGGSGGGKSKKDEDLRPWIENMKSWMRTKTTETDRMIETNRTDDDAYLASEEEPSSAVSNPQTPWNDVDIATSALRDLNSPFLNKISTSSKPSQAFQRHRAATVSEDSSIRLNGSSLSLPSSRHDRSVSSSSFTPPASASTTSSSHSRNPSAGGLSVAHQLQMQQENDEFDNHTSPSSATAPSTGAGTAVTVATATVLPSTTHTSHVRGSSYTSIHRLSANLTAKKSLPDLRLSHAKIIEGRRGDDDGRTLGFGIVANNSRHRKEEKDCGENQSIARSSSLGGELSPSSATMTTTTTLTTASGFDAMTAKSTPLGLNDSGNRGGVQDMNKRASQDTPLVDESRNSYFRRLSMLPASTISKAVSPALLQFVDAIRGILFALTQLHSALRQFLLFAVNDRVAGLFARVMEPASSYLTNLINALDRFDSVSRRSAPPSHAVRGVVDTTKESIAVFGKVLAVLRMQVDALKDADVRYTRQLLLNVYGSMAEVVCSWKEMALLLVEIRPLLGGGVPVSASALSQIGGGAVGGVGVAQSQSQAQARLMGGQKMVLSNSMTGRTPISPIPERGESHSPESVSWSVASNSMTGLNGISPGTAASSLAAGRTPSPLHQVVDSPISAKMLARSKNRRQAGSFSTEDVEKGMLMGLPGAGPSGDRNSGEKDFIDNEIGNGNVYGGRVGDSDAIIETPEGMGDEDDEGGKLQKREEMYQDGDYALAIAPTLSQQTSRRARHSHKPSSSASSGGHTLPSGHGGAGGVRKLSVDVRPPTPASATLFDDDLLDVIETATEIAFTVWLRLAEDIGGAAGLPAHAKSDSAGSLASLPIGGNGNNSGSLGGAPSPLTPVDMKGGLSGAGTSSSGHEGNINHHLGNVTGTGNAGSKIPPRTRLELLNLLSHAEQITTSLRESTMALRANPLNYAHTTLPDEAQQFIKTVVHVSELVKAISSAHPFATAVRSSLSKLTQATRECAILIQVSSLRPGIATAGSGTGGSGGGTGLQQASNLYGSSANGGLQQQPPRSARSYSPSAHYHLPNLSQSHNHLSNNYQQQHNYHHQPYGGNQSLNNNHGQHHIHHQSSTSDDYSAHDTSPVWVSTSYQVSSQSPSQSREGSALVSSNAPMGLRGLQLPSRQAALGRGRAVSGGGAERGSSPASAGVSAGGKSGMS